MALRPDSLQPLFHLRESFAILQNSAMQLFAPGDKHLSRLLEIGGASANRLVPLRVRSSRPRSRCTWAASWHCPNWSHIRTATPTRRTATAMKIHGGMRIWQAREDGGTTLTRESLRVVVCRRIEATSTRDRKVEA